MASLSLRFIVVIMAFALVAQPSVGQDEDTIVITDETKPAEQSNSSGILNFLLKPIKATYNQAKKFFGLSNGDFKDLLKDGFDEIQIQTFKVFMRAYNKTYDSPAEVRRRMALFFDRRRMIQESVNDFTEGRAPFVMRENAYTDWDESELKALASAEAPKTYAEMSEDERAALEIANQETASEVPDMSTSLAELDNLDDDSALKVSNSNYEASSSELSETNMTVMAPDRIPASKDWRDSGCVAEPMDQKKCGACYAIATINTVETMRCLNKVSSPILSSQQVIDCSTPRAGYQNHGCNGGWPTRVLKYLQDVGVVTRDSCYPFVRRQQTCQLRKVQANKGCTLDASPTGTTLRYKVLENERDILYHVAKTGPVITVMQARDSFLFYSKGIYDDPKCSRRRNNVDHAIAIVGYGRENGMDYWLIKNSWGTTDWGEGGYGKYRRGTRACSIGSWGWVITS